MQLDVEIQVSIAPAVVSLAALAAQAQALALGGTFGDTRLHAACFVSHPALLIVNRHTQTEIDLGTFIGIFQIDYGCDIKVLEGRVDFTTSEGNVISIGAYERLVVPAPDGAVPAVTAYTVDGVAADSWITGNAARDGRAKLASIPPPVDGNSSSLSGTWKLHGVISAVDNDRTSKVGDVIDRVWAIGAADCTEACVSSVKSSSGSTLGLYNVPGSGITWNTRAAVGDCADIETEEILRPDSYDVSWVNALRVTKSAFVVLSYPFMVFGFWFFRCQPEQQ